MHCIRTVHETSTGMCAALLSEYASSVAQLLFFFHTSFQIFETSLAFILKHPVFSTTALISVSVASFNFPSFLGWFLYTVSFSVLAFGISLNFFLNARVQSGRNLQENIVPEYNVPNKGRARLTKNVLMIADFEYGLRSNSNGPLMVLRLRFSRYVE